MNLRNSLLSLLVTGVVIGCGGGGGGSSSDSGGEVLSPRGNPAAAALSPDCVRRINQTDPDNNHFRNACGFSVIILTITPDGDTRITTIPRDLEFLIPKVNQFFICESPFTPVQTETGAVCRHI